MFGKTMKKAASLALAGVMGLSSMLCMAGCGPKEETREGYDNLKIYMQAGAEYVSAEKDPVWKAFEEATKTVISYMGPASDYYTALNAVMNDVMDSNRPDIIFCLPSETGGAYYKWANEYNFLVDIDALIAQNPGMFPNVEALLATDAYKSLEWNGCHTLIPWLTTDNIYSIYYRTDWLINVGEVNGDGSAKIPETLDDFERVLYKFRNDDPDRNGMKDTWGLSPNEDSFCWSALYHAFGVCEGWDYDENGQVIYMGEQEQLKNFLQWINKLYALDLIEPQFNSNSGTKDRDKFKDGTSGILLTDAEQHVKWVMTEFESKQGVGIVQMGSPLIGTGNVSTITGCVLGVEGAQGSSTRGSWWGGFSILSSSKNPVAALRYLDYLISEEGSTLNCYGVAGLHYTAEGKDEEGHAIISLSEEQLKSRGEQKRFGTSEMNGIMKSNGRYTIGSNLEGGVITIKDGKVDVYCQANVIDYHFSDLVQQAADCCVPYVDGIPETLVYPESVADAIVSLEEYRERCFNLFILGKYGDIGGSDFNSAWNAYISMLGNKKLDTVRKVVKETAEAYGYTAQ